ncbi:MAG: Holliday junction resolvase RuvX [Lachnospiraceae bacterium]|nr:Holliday junction resolvase RuvX [Lachnospiraceae bacterium]
MRIMGLDYGAATVGVAISDALLLTAQGIETIRREQELQLRKTYRRIEELVQEYEVERIVVGLPKHLNNSIGERAKKAEEFAEALKRRTGLPVELQDERLTTVEAHRILDAGGAGLEKKKAVVDKLAAVLILQNYLDRMNYENRKEV